MNPTFDLRVLGLAQPADSPNSLAFNIQLQATALLTVVYGNTVVSNGQALTATRESLLSMCF